MKHVENRIGKVNPRWKGWAMVSLVLLSVIGVSLAARKPKVDLPEYKPKDSRAELAAAMFEGGKELQKYRNEVGFDDSWRLDAAKQPWREWTVGGGESSTPAKTFEGKLVRIMCFTPEAYLDDEEKSKVIDPRMNVAIKWKKNGQIREYWAGSVDGWSGRARKEASLSEADQEYVWPLAKKQRLGQLAERKKRHLKEDDWVHADWLDDQGVESIRQSKHWRLVYGRSTETDAYKNIFSVREDEWAAEALGFCEDMWDWMYIDPDGLGAWPWLFKYKGEPTRAKCTWWIPNTGLVLHHQSGGATGDGAGLAGGPGGVTYNTGLLAHEWGGHYFDKRPQGLDTELKQPTLKGKFRKSEGAGAREEMNYTAFSNFGGGFGEGLGNWMQMEMNGSPATFWPNLYKSQFNPLTAGSYDNWKLFLMFREKADVLGRNFVLQHINREPGETPISAWMRGLKKVEGVDNVVTYFGDLVGELAARSGTWDFRSHSKLFPSLASTFAKHEMRHVYTEMIPVPDRKGWYIPIAGRSPQQYGYNLILIEPEEGATEMSATIEGLDAKDMDINFRMTFVAEDPDQFGRYGKMVSNKGTASLKREKSDKQYFVAVAACPDVYRPVGELPGGRTNRTYPYEITFKGCKPKSLTPLKAAALKQKMNRNDKEAVLMTGKPHPNGGGFVADLATVAKTAYVGPNAKVLKKAMVYAYARIEDNAIVTDTATVSDGAIVRGNALIQGSSFVSGHARVSDSATIGGRTNITKQSRVAGNAKVGGDGTVTDFVTIDSGEVSPEELSGNIMMAGNMSYGKPRIGMGLHMGWAGGTSGVLAYDMDIETEGLYANWQFDNPAGSNELSDRFANSYGRVRNGAEFTKQGERSVMEFNGTDQYVLVNKNFMDWRSVFVKLVVNPSANAADTPVFIAGQDKDNCVYFTAKNSKGKSAFVVRVGGKSETLEGPALKKGVFSTVQISLWLKSDQVRAAAAVGENETRDPGEALDSLLDGGNSGTDDIGDLELDDVVTKSAKEIEKERRASFAKSEPLNAVMYINDKEVAKKIFSNAPEAVRATVGYIGRDIEGDRHFKGAIDELIVYRKGFDSLDDIHTVMPEDVVKFGMKPEQLTAMLDAVLAEGEMVKLRLARDAEYVHSQKGALAYKEAFDKKFRRARDEGRPLGHKEMIRGLAMGKRLEYKTQMIYAIKERDFTLQQRQLRIAMRSRSVRPKGSDIYYLWTNKDHYDQLKDGAFADGRSSSQREAGPTKKN